jgi:hypothetical protein
MAEAAYKSRVSIYTPRVDEEWQGRQTFFEGVI